ncbi:hypothetical protein BC830DRAFT_549648 [Chytriomyces sp. MP71]|nr:hypothetical protein BC830DRAFT_549648 [Chytriomyces sp. MP71]
MSRWFRLKVGLRRGRAAYGAYSPRITNESLRIFSCPGRIPAGMITASTCPNRGALADLGIPSGQKKIREADQFKEHELSSLVNLISVSYSSSQLQDGRVFLRILSMINCKVALQCSAHLLHLLSPNPSDDLAFCARKLKLNLDRGASSGKVWKTSWSCWYELGITC